VNRGLALVNFALKRVRPAGKLVISSTTVAQAFLPVLASRLKGAVLTKLSTSAHSSRERQLISNQTKLV
jgi:hypothetical protein